jgi:hypothetical protein
MKKSPTFSRSRWSAVGAATAVTLGLGAIGSAYAADPIGSPSPKGVFVAIEPCRLMDTRSGAAIGPQVTPLSAEKDYRVQAAGTNGNCTLPAEATALVMNVTVVDPTENGFLTVWPSGKPRPNTSNLNFTGKQAPEPNAVTSRVGADGGLSFFSSAGEVNVIADVSGYYVPDQGAAGGIGQSNKTRFVSGDGSSIENGTALKAAITGLAGPALVRLAPGQFDLAGEGITLPDGVALQGSGVGVTKITMNGQMGTVITVAGASDISDLAVATNPSEGTATKTADGIAITAPATATVNVHDVNVTLDYPAHTGGSSITNNAANVVIANVTTYSPIYLYNKAGTMSITNSRTEPVAQLGAGKLTVQNTTISGSLDEETPTGATVKGTGTLQLDNVSLESKEAFFVEATGTVLMSNSRISAAIVRKATDVGTVRCANVITADYSTTLPATCIKP